MSVKESGRTVGLEKGHGNVLSGERMSNNLQCPLLPLASPGLHPEECLGLGIGLGCADVDEPAACREAKYFAPRHPVRQHLPFERHRATRFDLAQGDACEQINAGVDPARPARSTLLFKPFDAAMLVQMHAAIARAIGNLRERQRGEPGVSSVKRKERIQVHVALGVSVQKQDRFMLKMRQCQTKRAAGAERLGFHGVRELHPVELGAERSLNLIRGMAKE